MHSWRAMTALVGTTLSLSLAPGLAPAQGRAKPPFDGVRLSPGTDLWFAALFQMANPVAGGRLQFRARQLGFSQGPVSFTLAPPAALITFTRADSASGTLPSGGRWLLPLLPSFNDTGFPGGLAWNASTNLPAGLLRSREQGVLVVVGGRPGKPARGGK